MSEALDVPNASAKSPPIGYRWRSSVWYITLVVGVGIATDLGIYSMIIPVIPYRLEALGYTEISKKTSWLLLAYSLALVLSTPPIVWASEKLGGRRRTPLLAGIAFLGGSIIMFMFAPTYSVFVIARILQGISGSVIWVVGLALLCDSVPEEQVGQQLGLAMTGLTIGFAAGPPLGGLLYEKLGFHAPFIFCLGLVAFDFVARLVVIEPKDAAAWKADAQHPRERPDSPKTLPVPDLEGSPPPRVEAEEKKAAPEQEQITEYTANEEAVKSDIKPSTTELEVEVDNKQPEKLSHFHAVLLMMKSPRALASLANTLLYAIMFTSLEPTLTLRLKDVWGLSSLKVGLVYLAAAVPAFFSGAISGWSADKYGAEWATVISLVVCIPWYMILIIRVDLVLFIVTFCVVAFCLNGMVTPCTSELAATSRAIPAVTYGHVFGAFNIFYSIGSSIGPVIGGQIYDSVRNGWTVLCVINTALLVLSIIISLALVGNEPILQKITRRLRFRKV